MNLRTKAFFYSRSAHVIFYGAIDGFLCEVDKDIKLPVVQKILVKTGSFVSKTPPHSDMAIEVLT